MLVEHPNPHVAETPTATAPSAQVATGSHGRLLPAGVWGFLVAATAIPLGLLALRVRATGTSGHLSLPWDLFLGWVPLLVAVPLRRLARPPISRRRRWFVVTPLAVVWLLFLPNAPYLLTELIHLAGNDGPSGRPAPGWLRPLAGDGPFRPAPVWLDLMLLTSVAGCGALLTFAVVRPVHRALARWVGPRSAAVAVAGLLLVASFGVAIGRFERFNSWDALAKPEVVADRVADRALRPTDEPRVTACTLILSAVLVVGYFGSLAVARAPEEA